MLAVGSSLTDARALVPELISRRVDRGADRAFLQILLRWAGRFSPGIARDGDNGFFLDATGCTHLFGGETAMLKQIAARLRQARLSARLAMSDTLGASWALARFSASDLPVIASGEQARALDPLPVEALRLEPDTVAALRHVGLRHIGDLRPLTRSALARRFGMELVLRLDQAGGLSGEAFNVQKPEPAYEARRRFAEPIGLVRDVMAALAGLLDTVCAHLERAGRGARRLRLTFQHCDHTESELEIGLGAALTDPARIAPLFAPKVEKLDAGFGIDALHLRVVHHEALPPRDAPVLPALSAADADRTGDAGWQDLLGRLGNRVGFERLHRFVPVESHWPEREFSTPPAVETVTMTPDFPGAGPDRPLILFRPEPVLVDRDKDEGRSHPPSSFRWRRQAHQVRRVRGPERIAPEWWRDSQGGRLGDEVRDYWHVQTANGPRLWLFRAHRQPEAPPAWFVQGVFA